MLNAIEQRIVAGIAEHGWYGIHVHEDGDFPGFSYSIGFWESVGAPEFLIYGLPKGLMHSMLWEMFRQFKAGRPPNRRRTHKRSDRRVRLCHPTDP